MTISMMSTHTYSSLTLNNLHHDVQKPHSLPKRKQHKTTASFTPSFRSLLPSHSSNFSSSLTSWNPTIPQRTTRTQTEIFSSRNTHIIDIIKDKKDKKVTFSFEFYTPRYPESKDPDQVNNDFMSMVSRMALYCNPSYCDITCRPISIDMTVELAIRMQSKIDTMMHLTCLGMPIQKIDAAIKRLKDNGVRNIMALRGDKLSENGNDHDLVYGSDLVKHIKSKHGDFFGVAVAGYPEAHPDYIQEESGVATPEDYAKDLDYLKKKVEAGADFIVTQFFFDTQVFFKFVEDCRDREINCPIVPGIYPILDYDKFTRLTTLNRTKVPNDIRKEVERLKDDKLELEKYGIKLAVKMCKEILERHDLDIKELHFYTMNKEEPILKIVQELACLCKRAVPRSKS